MAQFDQELRIADVYAEALFELAEEVGRVAEVRAELDELAKLFRRQPEFEKFMTSRALEAEGRAAGLEKMFRNRLSDVVLNTLLVMNQHGRCGLLPVLRRRYVRRQEDAANEIEVTVTSALDLSRAQKAEAVEIAASASGKKPVIDPPGR
jgi:F-type H+-transporting ATPase subunit delta